MPSGQRPGLPSSETNNYDLCSSVNKISHDVCFYTLLKFSRRDLTPEYFLLVFSLGDSPEMQLIFININIFINIFRLLIQLAFQANKWMKKENITLNVLKISEIAAITSIRSLYYAILKLNSPGNLISGSSAFSKSSLYIWKFLVHVLLKPSMENFEHYFASMWNELNCVMALPFFVIRMKTDLSQSCGHCWVFQICRHIECLVCYSSWGRKELDTTEQLNNHNTSIHCCERISERF